MFPNKKYVDKNDIISEIVLLPQWRPFWTVEWHKLYNVKIRTQLSSSWKIIQKKRYYKGIYLNFFISYNFSIVSGGPLELLQTKHEWCFKTQKTWNEFPVKNKWKRGITKEYLLTSSYVRIDKWPLAAILDFREKNKFRSWETLGLFTGH